MVASEETIYIAVHVFSLKISVDCLKVMKEHGSVGRRNRVNKRVFLLIFNIFILHKIYE